MRKAPATIALLTALATPATSEAMLDGPGEVYCLGTGGECKRSKTPRDVTEDIRRWVANCGVQADDAVYLAEPSRGYFHALPKTPEAQACVTQAVRSVRGGVSNLRIRSGVDRPNGRRIVIVDYKPQRHRRNR